MLIYARNGSISCCSASFDGHVDRGGQGFHRGHDEDDDEHGDDDTVYLVEGFSVDPYILKKKGKRHDPAEYDSVRVYNPVIGDAARLPEILGRVHGSGEEQDCRDSVQVDADDRTQEGTQ